MPAAITRSIKWSSALTLLAVTITPWTRADDQAISQETRTLPPPLVMTAQQDHQRMMDLLQITSLRPGANGNNPQAPNAANYDGVPSQSLSEPPEPTGLEEWEEGHDGEDVVGSAARGNRRGFRP